MKKHLSLFAISFCVLFLFSACGELQSVRCAREYTEAVINNELKDAQKLLSADADIAIFPQDSLIMEVGKNVLKKTELAEATSVKEGKTKAVVALTINTPNPQKLMDRAAECAIEEYFSGTIKDKEGINTYIAQEIKSDLKMSGLTIESKTIEIQLVKEDKKWRITEEAKEAINNVVMGNIREVSISQ